MLACMLLAAGGGAPRAGRATDLAASRLRGRAIYTTGRSPRGLPLRARFFESEEIPASSLPCIQCHLSRGRGGEEAGVQVADLRWGRLSSPVETAGRRGRSRPPFTERTLGRAIREGIDPAGSPLDPVMPRYRIDDADLADLISYLRILGEITGGGGVPGVTPERIRVGTILPRSGPLARAGGAILGVLEREVASVNEGGGLHGRILEVACADAAAPGAGVEELLQGDGGVFCVVACAGRGASPEILSLLEERGVPVLGPLTFADPGAPGGTILRLLPGLGDQARAAARYLAREALGGSGPVAVVRPGPDRESAVSAARSMTEAFEREAAARGLALVPVRVDPESMPDAARRLAARGVGYVVHFGPVSRVRGILDAARGVGAAPVLVASQVLAGRNGSVEGLGGPVLLVAPPIAPGLSRVRGQGFAAVAAVPAGGAPPDRSLLALEMAAYAASRVLVEGLQRAGRDVSRASVLGAIRGAGAISTGVLPPARFGPGRPSGVRGALLVHLAESGRAVGTEWVEVRSP